MQIAACCTQRFKEQNQSPASHTFLASFAGRLAEALCHVAQPWLQASGSSIVLPYIHDSQEVGKILLLQNCPAPTAEGQGDLSRAGDSFLGHTFPGFVCFVFSWKALPHAYLVQHFRSRKYAPDMKQTLHCPLICQIISVNIISILQNTACF